MKQWKELIFCYHNGSAVQCSAAQRNAAPDSPGSDSFSLVCRPRRVRLAQPNADWSTRCSHLVCWVRSKRVGWKKRQKKGQRKKNSIDPCWWSNCTNFVNMRRAKPAALLNGSKALGTHPSAPCRTEAARFEKRYHRRKRCQTHSRLRQFEKQAWQWEWKKEIAHPPASLTVTQSQWRYDVWIRLSLECDD